MERMSVFTMFLVCLMLTPAYGQEKWTEIGLYGFLPGITGKFTTDRLGTDVDIPLSDTLDDLDFGGMVYGEHRHGNWSFVGSATYLKFSEEKVTSRNTGTSIPLDAELSQTLIDGFVGYRAFEKNHEKSQFGIDILAGARFNRVLVGLEGKKSVSGRELFLSQTFDADWANGVLALRMEYGHSSGWGVNLWADFGAGSDSTSYQLSGSLSYLFDNNIRVIGGYRFYSVDYEAEIDGKRYDLDLDYSGPILGIGYRF